MFPSGSKRVAVVGGVRTPFLRSGTSFEQLTAAELGGMAVKELVARMELADDGVDEVIYGTVIPSVARPNIAREVVFDAALSMRTVASSVVMACASSNRAITDASEKTSWPVDSFRCACGIDASPNSVRRTSCRCVMYACAAVRSSTYSGVIASFS